MCTLRPVRVRFGAVEFDLSSSELRSIETPDPSNPDANDTVVLREQVFRVLQVLVEREGKIVTREEIKSRLWANDTLSILTKASMRRSKDTGRTEEANRLADGVSREAPLDTIVQNYLVPTIRASVKLQQRDPEAAIDLLRGAIQ
jgi:hypothetical protein